MTAKEYLESKGLCDHDYSDSGMINHISELMEEYHTHEQMLVKNIAYEPVLANCNATLDRCECEEPKEELIKICLNCNGYIE